MCQRLFFDIFFCLVAQELNTKKITERSWGNSLSSFRQPFHMDGTTFSVDKSFSLGNPIR
jgi:hypothetical protein